MDKTVEQFKDDITNISKQTKLEDITSPTSDATFRYLIQGSVEQLYHLRRYFHLNYLFQILVTHTTQSERALKIIGHKPITLSMIEENKELRILEISTIFNIYQRFKTNPISQSLYDSRVYEINPQYTNIRHHNAEPYGQQVWDKFNIRKQDDTLEISSGDTVALAGDVEAFTKRQLEQMFKTVGVTLTEGSACRGSSNKNIKALLKGKPNGDYPESSLDQITKDAITAGIYIVEGKQLKETLDELSKAVYG